MSGSKGLGDSGHTEDDIVFAREVIVSPSEGLATASWYDARDTHVSLVAGK